LVKRIVSYRLKCMTFIGELKCHNILIDISADRRSLGKRTTPGRQQYGRHVGIV